MTKVTHLTLDERGELSQRRLHLREISGDADRPLETVGQDLRAARLRRGDELAQVSKVLRIRKDHLEALEEDRLEALPGRTYAVGFVRSYADYLGLDPVDHVERFKREIAGRSDGSPQVGEPPDTDDRRLPHGWAVMALVVLGVLGYGAYHLVKSVDRGATEQVAAPPTRIEQKPAPGSPPTSNPSGPATTGTTLGAPPAATVRPTAPRGAAVTTAPLPPVQVPGHGPTVPPVQTAAKPPAGSVAVPATPPPVPGLTYGALNRGVRIVLRANGPTRVLVQGADGKVYFNRVLRAGDSYRVPDRVGLSLTATDAGAVGVELDGQQMGAAGHSGQMTEALSLDPQAVVDRQGGRRP